MKKRMAWAAMLLCGMLAFSAQASEEESTSISIIGGADGPTSIFLAGKLGGEEEASAEEDVQELYALKTDFVGDNSAVGALILKLAEMGYLPQQDSTMEILSEEEPYGLRINYAEPFEEDVDDMFLKLTDGGSILLALIDNLSGIEFTFPVVEEEKEILCTVYWDKEAADTALAGDVKEYGASLEKFSEMLQ